MMSYNIYIKGHQTHWCQVLRTDPQERQLAKALQEVRYLFLKATGCCFDLIVVRSSPFLM